MRSARSLTMAPFVCCLLLLLLPFGRTSDVISRVVRPPCRDCYIEQRGTNRCIRKPFCVDNQRVEVKPGLPGFDDPERTVLA